MKSDSNKKRGTVLSEEADIYSKRETKKGWEYFKSLYGKEKKQYFIDYYLKKLIVIVIAVICTASLLYTVLGPKPGEVLYAALINNPFQNELISDIQREASESLNADPDSDDVIIDTSMYMNAEISNYDIEMKLMAMVAARQLDVLMLPYKDFVRQVDNGVACDLWQVLPKDMLELLSEYLIILTPKEQDINSGEITYGTRGAYGIEMAPFFERIGWETDNPGYVAAIVVNTEHMDAAVEFIRYLFK